MLIQIQNTLQLFDWAYSNEPTILLEYHMVL